MLIIGVLRNQRRIRKADIQCDAVVEIALEVLAAEILTGRNVRLRSAWGIERRSKAGQCIAGSWRASRIGEQALACSDLPCIPVEKSCFEFKWTDSGTERSSFLR